MITLNKKTFLISILVVFACISLAVNGVLIYIISTNQNIFQQHQVNKRVLDFRNMFTEKVLLSDQEIDFDTRLTLETSVRGLNDPEILAQWQKFTNSQTKEDATLQAKSLLNLLIQKTSQ